MTRTMEHPYRELPMEGPYEAQLGHALITMVDPHPGEERIYNRWYEDDHYISGAMALPWMFAGRRWVATRDLQLMRYPQDSAVAQPVTKGCYISLYWVTAGRMRDHLDWTMATVRRLIADKRLANHLKVIEQVYTSFQDHAGSVYRDNQGPRDIHALYYPYQGLVVEVVDAPNAPARATLERWLLEEHLPAAIRKTPAAICIVFRPQAFADNALPSLRKLDPSCGGRRLTVLWFLEADPRSCWTDVFASQGEAVARGGHGRVELVAPFIPTLPGTDTYVDQLR
jgi:hypothetical protein